MICPKCSKDYDDSYAFCTQCGEPRPEVAQQPLLPPVELPTQSGTPPPQIPYPQPAQRHSSSSKSWGKYAVVAGVALIVIIGLVVGLVLVLNSGDSGKIKAEATQFVQNGLNKDYQAQYKQLNTDTHNLMWVYMVGQTDENGEVIPSVVNLPNDEATLKEVFASSDGIFSGLFGSDAIKQVVGEGIFSGADVIKIDDQTYFVKLDYKDAPKSFTLFIKKQDGSYSVDFASFLVMGQPEIAKGVTQAVEYLIKNPTTENLDKAKEILDNAKTLKSELELWLIPSAKSTVSASAISEVEDAIKETAKYNELYSKIEKARSQLTK